MHSCARCDASVNPSGRVHAPALAFMSGSAHANVPWGFRSSFCFCAYCLGHPCSCLHALALPLLMSLNPLLPCPWKCLRLFVHIHTLAHARAATPHRSAMCLATLALGCSSQLVQLLLLLLLILMRSVAPWLLSLSLPFSVFSNVTMRVCAVIGSG